MKRELNYKKIALAAIVLLVVILIIIFGIKKAVKTSKLHKSYEYKLSTIGYSEGDIKIITDKLNDEQINKVLNSSYEENLAKIVNEKYFIYKNLDKYLNYYKTSNKDSKLVVSIVNVGADNDFYSDIKNTDTSKNELMLVNKFYGLSEDYVPSDLMEMPGYYAYADVYLSKSLYDDFTDMLDAASEKGYTLLASDGFRSYLAQKDIYDGLKKSYTTNEADNIAARPGHSEFQTGLSVVVDAYGKQIDEKSEEYKWIKSNAHKYGFIIRYPENTSDITGFETDYFRLRYVGREVASIIHNENITFDEYYAYYIENR